MGKYIIKRILSAMLTIWFIITITFFLMKVIPGDPFSADKMPNAEIREAIFAKYGLDKPLYIQYFKYLAISLEGIMVCPI